MSVAYRLYGLSQEADGVGELSNTNARQTAMLPALLFRSLMTIGVDQEHWRKDNYEIDDRCCGFDRQFLFSKSETNHMLRFENRRDGQTVFYISFPSFWFWWAILSLPIRQDDWRSIKFFSDVQALYILWTRSRGCYNGHIDGPCSPSAWQGKKTPDTVKFELSLPRLLYT